MGFNAFSQTSAQTPPSRNIPKCEQSSLRDVVYSVNNFLDLTLLTLIGKRVPDMVLFSFNCYRYFSGFYYARIKVGHKLS